MLPYIRLLHLGMFSLPGQYNDPELPDCGLELLHDREVDLHVTENLLAERPAGRRPPRDPRPVDRRDGRR